MTESESVALPLGDTPARKYLNRSDACYDGFRLVIMIRLSDFVNQIFLFILLSLLLQISPLTTTHKVAYPLLGILRQFIFHWDQQ